mmetsp:Transcript_16719/g.33705  ORF Transcript_16719/g.33705 Transcript_16719/m.33705 type:complete len:180 (-) Transcript_16719:48-587(-)
MQLLYTGHAPSALLHHFAVVAPHSAQGWLKEGVPNLLRFVDFLVEHAREGTCGVPAFDTSRLYVTGFSDGATAALRACVSRRFAACLSVSAGRQTLAAYLKGVPVWLVHAANDVVLPVDCTDETYQMLRCLNGEGDKPSAVRYTRHQTAPDSSGCNEGHCTPLLTYKSPEVYAWLLSKR